MLEEKRDKNIGTEVGYRLVKTYISCMKKKPKAEVVRKTSNLFIYREIVHNPVKKKKKLGCKHGWGTNLQVDSN